MLRLAELSTSPVEYSGPFFNVTRSGIGYATSYLCTACMQFYASSGGLDINTRAYRHEVANCMLNNLDEQEKAHVATHTYTITLWPAFVSIIVAMFADGAPMAYDNLGWSAVHLLTSGAIPGFATLALPHQVVVADTDEGQRLCRDWTDDKPARKISRWSRRSIGTYTPGGAWIEGLLLAFSFALWAGFIVAYVMILQNSFPVAVGPPWYYSVLWYLFSACPAIGAGVPQLVANNVELYEPRTDARGVLKTVLNNRMPAIRSDDKCSTQAASVSNMSFELCKTRSGLHTWYRIAYLQLTCQPYRIMIKPLPRTVLLAVYQYVVFTSRLAVFIWGSIIHGALLFVPTSGDFWVCALLVFATVTPRLLAKGFLRNSRRGADLVVFVDTPI